jgi:hypothetical protein
VLAQASIVSGWMHKHKKNYKVVVSSLEDTFLIDAVPRPTVPAIQNAQDGAAPRKGHCGIRGCEQPTLELRDSHKCKRFAVCRNYVHPLCAFGHVPPLCHDVHDDIVFCSIDCKE